MASIILKATKWLGHMAMCSMNAIGCAIFFATHAGSAIGETTDCHLAVTLVDQALGVGAILGLALMPARVDLWHTWQRQWTGLEYNFGACG